MRRKSERNKVKASPEKKVEKPTRKSTRRRNKKSPSTSPDRESACETVTSTPTVNEDKKETVSVHPNEPTVVHEETEETKKITSTEADTATLSPEEDNNGSVWKVARADASPGEIQKLKLCRQRNISEVSSDNSVNRKKSSKWQGSGEGVGEEDDSIGEPLTSSKRVSGGENTDDPSSSHPGQDSSEEVSDCKEILSKTTSANLSDDKPNIDQQGETLQISHSNLTIECKPNETTEEPPTTVEPALNDESTQDMMAPEVAKKESTGEVEEVDNFIASAAPEEGKEELGQEVEKSTIVKQEPQEESVIGEEEEEVDVRKVKIKKESSVEEVDNTVHKNSSSSDDDHSNDTNSSLEPPPRRKFMFIGRHLLIMEGNNSDTSESEDNPRGERKIKEDDQRIDKKSVEELEIKKKRSKSPEESPHSSLLIAETECNKEVDNNVEVVTDQSNNVNSSWTTAGSNKQACVQKPTKVNLKRSFSRTLTESSTRKDNNDGKTDGDTMDQNKENCAIEPKCVPKRRRWGMTLPSDTPAFSVSTDSLKALVPGAKPLSLNEVRLSKDDDDNDSRKTRDRKHSSNNTTIDQKNREESINRGDTIVDNDIGKWKICIVNDVHVDSPSPSSAKPTNVLLIKNLVRPFTLNQIKELLSRTGTIVENGFWMDRIKSKCYVEYTNEDQAFETRQALHGISWPLSNPKKLQVEYATKEDMVLARETSKDQPVQRKTKSSTSDTWQQEWTQDERNNALQKVTMVREWDLGKEDGQVHLKEKEREKKEQDKKRRQRSRSPNVEAHLPAPARKFKKKEDEPPPAKLLDDLFRKTKATPCIYWLPLTNEQIVVKKEMRRQHMAEHARRLEEMRRAERNRERDRDRRRRSPRK